VLFGLNLTHSRGDIYRALLEGIACATNHIVETYAQAGQRPERVRAVGGGTKNRVWAQATSDISGLAQSVCRHTVGASYGDAFLAAVGVGDAAIGDIARWNPPETTIEPAPSEATRRQYRVYREIYRRNADLMHDLGQNGE
jgi:xylulokinase